MQKKHFYSKRAPQCVPAVSEFQNVRMPVFLSPEDVVVLTGFIQSSKQCEALKVLGIPFTQNSTGKPVVLVSALLASISIKKVEKKYELDMPSAAERKGLSHDC